MRIGEGYDVHGFCKNKPLIIGGVHIPYNLGLEGHSDADVLLHAIMNALLGAAALGDIGQHFPNTEQQYYQISSRLLLKKVKEKLDNLSLKIGNIDATIVAQLPKMTPYIQNMRENIAKDLNIQLSQINIKATTTERLGFIGREEGMAAYAVTLLFIP